MNHNSKKIYRILIADDDPTIQRVLRDFLNNLGYEVASVMDGCAAITELEKNHCDLLLSDIAMPCMDGIELVKSVRSDDNKITYSIEDDGNGFDPSNVADPTLPENITKCHGRGITLIKMCMDEVSFNEKGNEIRMVKNFPDNAYLLKSAGRQIESRKDSIVMNGGKGGPHEARGSKEQDSYTPG